jgi:transcriptional regulator with XRE-family HTH domain
MSAPHGPVGARRRLGAELRRLRTKADLHLDDVARLMRCSTSKISRLETGKGGAPKLPDVRELMRIYGVTSDTEQDMLLRLVDEGRIHGWWEPLTDGVQAERFVLDAPGRYAALENDAVAVHSFELTILHGLLQTPDYSRAVMRAVLAHHGAGEIERLVELRQRRQKALTLEPPLALSVVLDEAVIRRPVGSPSIMADQLDALLERTALPNVTVQIFPFHAGFHRSHHGSFVVLEYAADVGGDLVYIEGHAGDTYLDNPDHVTLYKDVLADVTGRALTPEASRVLIHGYQREYAKGSPP